MPHLRSLSSASFTAEQLRAGDSSNGESEGHRQGRERGEQKKRRDGRDFSDKGGLCVAINLGANHQSEAVGGLVSATGQRSSWTENRGRTVSALLFYLAGCPGNDVETETAGGERLMEPR